MSTEVSMSTPMRREGELRKQTRKMMSCHKIVFTCCISIPWSKTLTKRAFKHETDEGERQF